MITAAATTRETIHLANAVIKVMRERKIPRLSIFASDDGVHVEFIGARKHGDRITPAIRLRREHALHELMRLGFRVMVAIAPTHAEHLHLLVKEAPQS